MSTGRWGQAGCGEKQQDGGFAVCCRVPPFMRSTNDPIDHSSGAVTSYLHPSCYPWRMHLCSVCTCAVQKWKLCQKSNERPYSCISDFSAPLHLCQVLSVCLSSELEMKKGQIASLAGIQEASIPCTTERKKKMSAHFLSNCCWDAEGLSVGKVCWESLLSLQF